MPKERVGGFEWVIGGGDEFLELLVKLSAHTPVGRIGDEVTQLPRIFVIVEEQPWPLQVPGVGPAVVANTAPWQKALQLVLAAAGRRGKVQRPVERVP